MPWTISSTHPTYCFMSYYATLTVSMQMHDKDPFHKVTPALFWVFLWWQKLAVQIPRHWAELKHDTHATKCIYYEYMATWFWSPPSTHVAVGIDRTWSETLSKIFRTIQNLAENARVFLYMGLACGKCPTKIMMLRKIHAQWATSCLSMHPDLREWHERRKWGRLLVLSLAPLQCKDQAWRIHTPSCEYNFLLLFHRFPAVYCECWVVCLRQQKQEVIFRQWT